MTDADLSPLLADLERIIERHLAHRRDESELARLLRLAAKTGYLYGHPETIAAMRAHPELVEMLLAQGIALRAHVLCEPGKIMAIDEVSSHAGIGEFLGRMRGRHGSP